MLAARILKRQRLILVLQLNLESLRLSLVIQNFVWEEDEDDNFILGLERATVDLSFQFQCLQLIYEDVLATGRHYKEVISLRRSLGRWVKLSQQLFSLIMQLLVVRRLFGCQPSDVPVIELAVARPNYQINSVRFLRSEGEVKSVVPLIVTFEHLLFK